MATGSVEIHFSAMARFYFDIVEGSVVVDEEGLDCPHRSAAEAYAREMARDLVAADVRAGQVDWAHAIRIRGAKDGPALATVTFGEAVSMRGAPRAGAITRH